MRHEFPDAWQLLLDTSRETAAGKWLGLRLDRRHFPFIPGGREIWLDKITILFGGLHDHLPERLQTQECPCPEPGILAHRDIAFVHEHEHEHHGEKIVRCFAGKSWPDLYCGMVDTDVGPLGSDRCRAPIAFRLPHDQRLERVFLLCRYSLGKRCDRLRPWRGPFAGAEPGSP